MNYAQKLCLSMATVISFSNFGMMQQVIRDDTGFKIFDGKQVRPVQSCFVDPLLKRMNSEQLTKFVEQGNRIKAIRLSDGEHRLQAMVPGKGGGPVTGAIAYWVVKTLCYGTAVAAASTVVVATGGAAGAAVGALGAAATLGAGAGATVVGGAIAGAGLAGEAVTATAAVVSGAGGIAAAAAAVESASMAALVAGTLCPFLP